MYIGRVPSSRTAPTRNFDGDTSVLIRYLVQPVGRGNATRPSHRRRDVCRAEIKRAMTIRDGLSVTHARSDRGTAHRTSDGASQCILGVCRLAADLKRPEKEACLQLS